MSLRARFLFALLGLLTGAVCGVADLVATPPTHSVTGEVILSSPVLGGSAAGRDTGQELVNEMPTIALVATSDEVLREVLASTGIREDVKALRSEVHATAVPQSLILDVKASLPTSSQSVAVVDDIIAALPRLVELAPSTGTASRATVGILRAPHSATQRIPAARTLAVAVLLGGFAGLALPAVDDAFGSNGRRRRRTASGRGTGRRLALVAVVAATGLLIPFGTGLPVLVLAALVTLAVSLADAWYGLLVTVSAVVLLPTPFSVGVGSATITIGRALLFALAIGWFAQLRIRSRRIAPRRTAFDVPLLVLLGAILASIVVNIPALSRYELLGGLRAFGLYAVDFGLLFVITASVLRDRERRLQLLRFVAGLIGVTSAAGMVELATRKDVFQFVAPVLPIKVARQINALSQAAVLTRGQFIRLHSTFEQPLVFASALLLGLPIAIALALSEPTGRRRTAWAAVAVLDGVALLFTASRAAYLLGGLELAMFLVLGPPGRGRRTVVVAAAAIAGVLIAVPDLRATMSHFFHFSHGGRVEGSVGSRLSGIKETLPLVAKEPVFGYGAHTFSVDELVRNRLFPPGGTSVLDDAYLLQLAETGAVGLLALAGVLLFAWTTAWRTFRTALSTQQRVLGLALAAAVVGWTGMGFAADVYVFNAPPKVFFVILAAVAVCPMEVLPDGRGRKGLSAGFAFSGSSDGPSPDRPPVEDSS